MTSRADLIEAMGFSPEQVRIIIANDGHLGVTMLYIQTGNDHADKVKALAVRALFQTQEDQDRRDRLEREIRERVEEISRVQGDWDAYLASLAKFSGGARS